MMLTGHLLNHEGSPDQARESSLAHLDSALGWDTDFRTEVVARARRGGLVAAVNGSLILTDAGRSFARDLLAV